MLRPQDIVVLLQLSTGDRPSAQWSQTELALSTGLSQAEVHNSLKRAAESGLYEAQGKTVMRKALLELLLHGVKYVFPAHRGALTRGVPTAWAAEPLSLEIAAGDSLELPVWPHPDGKIRGSSVDPLYKSVPELALRDPLMHEILALVDAIRIGRARERKLAEAELRQRLGL